MQELLFILLIYPDLITENTNEDVANLGIVQFLKSTVTALSLWVTADIQLEILRGQEMAKNPSVIPVEVY